MAIHWRLAGLFVAVLAAAGCEPIQEPWAEGEQYAQERQRSDAQAQELRQRVLRVQQDR